MSIFLDQCIYVVMIVFLVNDLLVKQLLVLLLYI